MGPTRRCHDHDGEGAVRPLRDDGYHDDLVGPQLWQQRALDELHRYADGEGCPVGPLPPISRRELDLLLWGQHWGIWARVAAATRGRIVVRRDCIGLAVNVRPNGCDSWAGLSTSGSGWLVWVAGGKLALSWEGDPQ